MDERELAGVLQNKWPKWKIVRKLGSGTYGVVFEVESGDLAGTQHAAIKVLRVPEDISEIEEKRAEGQTDEEIDDLFRFEVINLANEVKLMEDVKGNTNIVNIEDRAIFRSESEIAWYLFIRMELLKPLKKIPHEKMDEDEIIKLGIDMCSALEVCGKHKIVHRDIKPENIL